MQTKPCVFCGKPGQLTLNQVQMGEYREWLATGKAAFIQDALPNWSTDMRELYLTGTHPECWKANMKEDEDV